MNIQSMVNLYPISKTLRFELQPVGKTRENFELNKMLEADESLAEKYTKVSGYIRCTSMRNFVFSSNNSIEK